RVISDSSINWIVENFDLTPAQIHAALPYYYDHQNEIDESIHQAEADFQREAAKSENTLEKLKARLKKQD
ncbi:MAG TPA: hypothetical protein VJZ27_10110, partial [Aggregatilineales bacterium]|nr:hypothetical protein [Aggregatilineales bacterium]